jgi:4-hydroxybenzoate polyprenyltransferase
MYLRMARVDHYIKNTFIIPGFAFQILFFDLGVDAGVISKLIVAFVSTCLISSANYTINEFLDRKFDAVHPIKSRRSASQNELKLLVVCLQYFLFAVFGLLLSSYCSREVFILEASLLLMGILYNVAPFRFKDIAVLDVLSESVNNPLRFAIGWYAASNLQVVPTSALISYFGSGIFLMSLKRYAELAMLGGDAGSYRKSFNGWNPNKLLVVAIAGGLFGAVFMGIFFVLWKIELVLTTPFMILLFSYYLFMSLSLSDAAHAPEKLYKDRVLIVLTLIFGLSFVVFLNLNIGSMESLINVSRS